MVMPVFFYCYHYYYVSARAIL